MSASLFDLSGRRALVTGGASGIGRICAEGLLGHGASVVLTSRKSQPDVLADLGRIGPCELIVMDLADPDAAARVVEEYRSLQPELDILVNNAGATWGASFENYPPSAWSKVLNLDVAVPFQLVQGFAGMLEASGSRGAPSRVINIGSVDGDCVGPFENYAYGAAKAALHHMTRVLALNLAEKQITVNCIAPGPIPTRMTKGILESTGSGLASANPLGRLTEPEDIIGALVYLTAAAGSYITGATVPVDGGFSLGPWLHALDGAADHLEGGTAVPRGMQEDRCS